MYSKVLRELQFFEYLQPSVYLTSEIVLSSEKYIEVGDISIVPIFKFQKLYFLDFSM